MSRKYILFTAHMHTQYGIRMSLVHIQIILCAYAHMFDTRCDFVGSYPEPQGWIVMRRFSSSKADMFWWNCDDMFLRKQRGFVVWNSCRSPKTTNHFAAVKLEVTRLLPQVLGAREGGWVSMIGSSRGLFWWVFCKPFFGGSWWPSIAHVDWFWINHQNVAVVSHLMAKKIDAVDNCW